MGPLYSVLLADNAPSWDVPPKLHTATRRVLVGHYDGFFSLYFTPFLGIKLLWLSRHFGLRWSLKPGQGPAIIPGGSSLGLAKPTLSRWKKTMYDFTTNTRESTRSFLESAGIFGVAAEAILKETSPQRAAYRCQLAREAATAYLYSVAGDAQGVEVNLGVWYLVLLDWLGVGGRAGVEGLGTSRHPAFRDCGKGRKHASDGGAWSAAIEGAPIPFTEGAVRFVLVGGELCLKHPTSEACSPLALTQDIEGLAWRLTLAREGLRRSLGLPSWFRDEAGFLGYFAWDSLSPEEWAIVVNSTVANLEARRRQRKLADLEALWVPAVERGEHCVFSRDYDDVVDEWGKMHLTFDIRLDSDGFSGFVWHVTLKEPVAGAGADTP